MLKLILSILIATSVYGMNADELVKAVQHNLQSDSGYAKITMVVTTARGERTMKMESWNRGMEKSFIKVLYPKKDRGITFLKLDTVMWQYVPKIERIIKIPSSMMMQSWMGSDFTNDDMAKESSIVDDYYPQLTATTDAIYKLTLYPKPDAAVVWGRIEMEVDKTRYFPIKAVYFDEDGNEQRVLYYSDVKEIDERFFPRVMTLIPSNKEKNKTVVTMDEIDFDAPIEDARFIKSALKRYSR